MTTGTTMIAITWSPLNRTGKIVKCTLNGVVNDRRSTPDGPVNHSGIWKLRPARICATPIVATDKMRRGAVRNVLMTTRSTMNPVNTAATSPVAIARK